jgi:glutamyl-tRNA reductase
VFIACGLNHKTAPIEIRERLSVSSELEQQKLIEALKGHADIQEVVVLSTCNRTEIYCASHSELELPPWLAKHYDFEVPNLRKHLYTHQDEQGIKHAIRVTAGLDSMMLGEPQIFGQMKTAYQLAEKHGAIGQTLRPIFHHVFAASKKIRTKTELGVSPVSVAYAGVNLISQTLENLEDLKVLLIGAGETSQLVAKYLKNAGVSQFMVANRDLKNASNLAHELNGESYAINDLALAIERADIIISATACPLPFISKRLVQAAMEKRPESPKFFLDLAVPRDIEANVAELNKVFLYNVDSLQTMVEKNLDQRKSAAFKAEEIIDFELNEYINWLKGQNATEAILNYREQTKEEVGKEIARTLKQLDNGASYQDCLEELGYRLHQKIAHQPTQGLRRAAKDGRQDLVELAAALFQKKG